MIAIRVDDMTYCVGAITRAVRQVDAAAEIAVDLASKRVEVRSAAGEAALAAAIREAGYTPGPAQALAQPSPRHPGGCRGCH